MSSKWLRGPATAVLVSAALLVGCSSDTTPSSSAEGEKGEVAAKPKTDPTTITFLFAATMKPEDFEKQYVERLKAKFPHVTLKYLAADNKSQNVENFLTTGEEFDIVVASVNYTSEYLVGMNLAYDISPLIRSYKYDVNRLEPSTVDIQRKVANGGIYGLPLATTAFTLFYNKDVFDKFGVPYPKDDMLWDETYELTRRVTREDSGKQYYGFLISNGHYVLSNQLSYPMLEDGTRRILFTEDNYKKILNNFIRFYQIPGMEKNKYLLTRDVAKNATMFFEEQNVAMYAYMSSLRHQNMATMNWDIVTLPSFPEAPGVGTQSYPSYAYLSSTSKNKEQTFELMAYLTSDEHQKHEVSEYARFTILRDSEPIMANFAQGSNFASYYKGKNLKALLPKKYAAYTTKDQYTRVAEAPLATAMQQAAKGQKDLNTALREQAEIVKIEIEKLGN